MSPIVRKEIFRHLPPLSGYSSALILSDAGLFELYGETLARQLPFYNGVFLAPKGEAAKDLGVVEACWKRMAEVGMDSRSVVITLGGGSICDLGGFVASTYMRGISLIHCPTTLLAMVDAAIGGKTAINFAGEKNLVGTIHEAEQVICDPEVLSTLDPAELRAGFAEVIKMGMIADARLLEMEDLVEVIERCIALKMEICAEGRRTLLNWGHTFAHALEVLLDYRIRHGEAVAIGMGCAARLSVEMGLADESLVGIQEEALKRRGLSTLLPDVDLEEMVRLMGRDKKGANGNIACVVSRGIGEMELWPNVDPQLICLALKNFRGYKCRVT